MQHEKAKKEWWGNKKSHPQSHQEQLFLERSGPSVNFIPWPNALLIFICIACHHTSCWVRDD
jgi:hypothetical protein